MLWSNRVACLCTYSLIKVLLLVKYFPYSYKKLVVYKYLILFGEIACLFLILVWWGMCAVMVCVLSVCLHAYILLCLPALDSNDAECTKDGEVFEYRGEDQGQADQGKPSELVASLILVFTHAWFITVYENALFFMLLLPLDSNYWRLGSTSQLLSSSWMTPLNTHLSPGLVAWWLASWPLINLVVEQKL
jgi:hypothetical protein